MDGTQWASIPLKGGGHVPRAHTPCKQTTSRRHLVHLGWIISAAGASPGSALHPH